MEGEPPLHFLYPRLDFVGILLGDFSVEAGSTGAEAASEALAGLAVRFPCRRGDGVGDDMAKLAGEEIGFAEEG